MKMYQFNFDLNGKKEVKVICAPNQIRARQIAGKLITKKPVVKKTTKKK